MSAKRTEEDYFDVIAGQLAMQGRSGNREAVDILFRRFIYTMEHRTASEQWMDYETWEKIPLALIKSLPEDKVGESGLKLIGVLERAGYTFVGELDRMSDVELLAIRNIRMDRVRELRSYIEAVKVKWGLARNAVQAIANKRDKPVES